MTFWVATGTLGSGKTSWAVTQALRYMKKGRRVAANFSLDFTTFPEVKPDAYVTILPDVVKSQHLIDLGRGGPNELNAGLLIIDEGVFSLNARNYNDPDRQKFIEWLALSRKLGWDVILIIQHIQALDKQVRLLYAEYLVVCRRLDRLKLMGIIPLPKIHLAAIRYGSEAHAAIAGRDFFRPATIGKAYDTAKLFEHSDKDQAPYCTLTRQLAVTRYLVKKKPFNFFDVFLLPLKFIMALSLICYSGSSDMNVIRKKLRAA